MKAEHLTWWKKMSSLRKDKQNKNPTCPGSVNVPHEVQLGLFVNNVTNNSICLFKTVTAKQLKDKLQLLITLAGTQVTEDCSRLVTLEIETVIASTGVGRVFLQPVKHTSRLSICNILCQQRVQAHVSLIRSAPLHCLGLPWAALRPPPRPTISYGVYRLCFGSRDVPTRGWPRCIWWKYFWGK